MSAPIDSVSTLATPSVTRVRVTVNRFIFRGMLSGIAVRAMQV